MERTLGRMKRALSVVLAAAMIVTGLPQASALAYAAETENVTSESGFKETETLDGTGSGEAQTPDEGSPEGTELPDESGLEGTEKPDESDPEGTDASGENVFGDQNVEETDQGKSDEEDSSGENRDEEEPVEDEPIADDGKTAEIKEVPVKGKIAAYASETDTDIEASGTNNAGTVTWTLYTNGKLVVEGDGEFALSGWDGYYTTYYGPWKSYSSKIESAEIRVTGATSAAGMFNNCYNLREVDLSGFDTSKVVNMRDMFYGCQRLTSLDLSGLQTGEVTNMYRMFYDCNALTDLNLSGLQTGKVENMSDMFLNCYNLTSLDLSSFDTGSVKDMSRMFYGCNMDSLDLSGFNVSNVENMSEMFYNCDKLTALDLGSFRTGSATNMKNMFHSCGSLASLDISGFDTSKVTNMEGMFDGCSGLTELDLSNFDISSVTSMNDMFRNCESLVSVDLSSFDMDGKNTTSLFSGCSSLAVIQNPIHVGVGISLPESDGHAWRKPDGTAVTNLQWRLEESITIATNSMAGIAFTGTSGEYYTLQDEEGIELELLSRTGTDGEKVVDIGSKESFTFTVMPKEGYTVKSIAPVRGADSTMTISKGSLKNQYVIAPADGEKGYVRDEEIIVEMMPIADAVLTVTYDRGVVDAVVVNGDTRTENKPETIQVSNDYSTSLYVKIEGSEYADPQEVVAWRLLANGKREEIAYLQDADAMSAEEKELARQGWFIYHFERVQEDMSFSIMARYPSAEDDIASGVDGDIWWVIDKNGRLKVKGVGNLSTNIPWLDYRYEIKSAVIDWETTDASDLFQWCSNLEEVDIKYLKAENMSGLFDSCTSLAILKLEGMDTSVTTNMYNMFYGCESLTALDLSGLDISSVTNMGQCFVNCKNLVELNLSGLDTGNVTDMNAMFAGCTNLTMLDLSSLDTGSVTDMNSMFSGCTKLAVLDINGLDMGKVTSVYNMFYGCESLETLDLSSFDAGSVTNWEGMFYNCTSLVELKTPYNVRNSIELPQIDGNKWRRADKTDTTVYTELPMGTEESVTLTTSLASIRFTGTGFIVKDSDGKTISDNEVLLDKGSKDELVYTVEAEEGYMVKGVKPAGQNTTLILNGNPQAPPYQYTIAPVDAEKGYVWDEELKVQTMVVTDYTMTIAYPADGVADTIVSNGSSQAKNKPGSVKVSNAYDTLLYVKTEQTGIAGIRIPVVTVSSVDEEGNSYYSKMIPFLSDTDSMSEEEKALAQDGYCIFNLGTLYADASVDVQIKTLYQAQIVTSEFPGDVRVIRYVRDENGLWKSGYCGDEITLEAGEYFYFQVEWDQISDNDCRWCLPEVTVSPEGQVTCEQLDGVDGKVWRVRADSDMTVHIDLKPYEILLEYIDGDFVELRAESGNIRLSDNKKALEVYGGDSLSLSFGLADNISLESVFCNEEPVAFVKDAAGRYTVTIEDLTKIHDATKITFATKDNLDRYLLSDPELYVEVLLAQGNFYYTGKPIEPKVSRVTLSGSNIKRVTLKEKLDYTVSYANNTNAGVGTLTITAAADSKRYRGSCSVEFNILKAVLPEEGSRLLQVDAENAGIMQQVDLSELFIISTKYEKVVKPLKYELYTNDSSYRLGGVLRENPVIQGSVMTYRTWADADKNSEPALIALRASFDNYEDTVLYVQVEVVRKEALTLGGTVTVEDKVYNGEPAEPDPSGLQVTAVDGQKPTDAESILKQIRKDLIYHYTGTGSTIYDSDTAPVDVGTYRVAVAVSEENEDFKSSYYDGTDFTISKRTIEIAADDVTLYKDDTVISQYGYQVLGEGLASGDSVGQEPIINCAALDMTNIGEYPITVDTAGVRVCRDDGSDVTANYNISGKNGTLHVEMPKPGSYTVTYNLSGHGDDIIRSGMEAGSLLIRPADPEAEGYLFLDWYSDKTLKKAWNFDTDTIQADITLYAGWTESVTADQGMTLCVQEITPQFYTGKAIKPAVTVYAQDGKTLLKAGKDYVITKYVNNVEADTSTKKFAGGEIPKGGRGVQTKDENTKKTSVDTSEGFNDKLAYVVITGKGDYKGTVCMNFHIEPVSISEESDGVAREPASGFKLKYTDQFAVKANKRAKIVSSLKYKKTLVYGTDYSLTVKKSEDGNADGQNVELSNKGEIWLNAGEYELSITGMGNYKGTIVKDLHIADNQMLLKNAKITYAKTVKNVSPEGLAEGVTQTDVRVRAGGIDLQENEHYTISYRNNYAVGTASMIVTAIDGSGYTGSKSVAFKIQGIGFKEKLFEKIQLQDLTYNGTALTQNDVTLALKEGGKTLAYGDDYTISYKNNIKVGTATMTFTARPESGYSGSFKKTFKIRAVDILSADLAVDGARKVIIEGDSVWEIAESIPYRKSGAKPTDQFTIRFGNYVLTEGRDYKASYKDHKTLSADTDRRACMTISGKGNFTGSIKIYYDITNASLYQLYQAGEITITARAVPFDRAKSPRDDDEYEEYESDEEDGEYEYTPAITVKDGKQALRKGIDFEVLYSGNFQSELEECESAAPYVEITGIGAYGGEEEEDVITIPLSIYQRKLSSKNIYVVYDDEDPYVYTGQQIRPNVTVYYGNAADVNKARRNKETDEEELTRPKYDEEVDDEYYYAYGLTQLSMWDGESGNYTISYGANIKQGKGTITVRGVGGYTGSGTVQFKIDKKDIYMLSQD